MTNSVRAARWNDETWRYDAGCAGFDTLLFFPETERQDALEVTLAKQVCANCPVREPCLEFALQTLQNNGIWGGATEEERTRMKRARRRCVAQSKSGTEGTNRQLPQPNRRKK
jgi:WhiB family transcriptional regulator, redox-sensing transcriptional regulator